MLSFILAISPIVIVLVGIMAFRVSAAKIAPLALLWGMFLALTYFNITDLSLKDNIAVLDANVWKGLKEGFKIVVMIFGAFTILNALKATGAIEDVKAAITQFSGDDRRAQLIIIGIFVPIFLEGAAGAGAPAALTAPFLTALGFDPIIAIAVSLLGDCTCTSWGGAGLTTISGGAALVNEGISTTALNSAMVGRINSLGLLIVPLMAVLIAFGPKGLRGIMHFVIFAGVSGGLVMFALSNFVGPEITSLGTGVIGVILCILFVKFVPIKTPKEYRYKSEGKIKRKYSTFQALSPYIYILILIPLVRYGVPALFPENGFATMCLFGYICWVDAVILLCSLLGAITLGMNIKQMKKVVRQTVKSLAPVMITMGSLLCLSYVMQSETTGMMSTAAKTIAGIAGPAYPAAAVFIGSFGSFITGTGLGSNIMFAGMHIEASPLLGINPITVFAGQNAAGSLGNLICPNNVVAACATVNSIGREGDVLRITFRAFFIILIEYMVIAMLYTYMIFPNFGP
jgi:lactate permease